MKCSVSIPPYNLNINKIQLLQHLKDKYNFKHHKDYGYIINVKNINEIVDTYINDYDNHIIIMCECDLDSINIKKNIIIPQCKITMILLHGIFLEFNTLNILIPATDLTSFTFKNNIYTREDKTLSVGDKIDVKITDMKYSNQEYKCIGSYVN